jgi:lipopolysaccharide/colanic/teichoic acid biosynthesis glycosyltransferase
MITKKEKRQSRWGDFPPPPRLPRHSGKPEQSIGLGIPGRIAALFLLCMLAPVLVLIAIAIKLESLRAPVFFRQKRVGLDRRRNGNGLRPHPVTIERMPDRRRTKGHGQPFGIWKFRTMIPDAEAKSGPVWATEDDPRITRLGRVLRPLRLDELPQLINVACGEMSLIGPRPERPYFVEKLVHDLPRYQNRLAVPPGITGLAQVEREYDASITDVQTKLKYDLFYVKNRSRQMNLKILLKTVDVMLRGRGAR